MSASTSVPVRPPLPPIDAPLPDLNHEHTESESILTLKWNEFKSWAKDLLNRDSTTFSDGSNKSSSSSSSTSSSTNTFSLSHCCNISNLRTRLLLMCLFDLLTSLYGLASANRVRLISPLLNLTGLVFIGTLIVGMAITVIGIFGILQRHILAVRMFFYWSILALILNFILSCIDLTTIDKQCDFIWSNFDHSAYAESDRQLFSRQCESYAFVFFSVVMVGIAFARLYYIYLQRQYYISIDPDQSQGLLASGRGYGYHPVSSSNGAGGGAAYASSVNQTVYEEDEEDEA